MVRATLLPLIIRKTQGVTRPGSCPGKPHPKRKGYILRTVARIQNREQQAPGSFAPGLKGPNVKFPRTRRGVFRSCQGLSPAVQTVFAKCILAPATPFVLCGLLWLSPSLSSSSLPAWLPRPHSSDCWGSM